MDFSIFTFSNNVRSSSSFRYVSSTKKLVFSISLIFSRKIIFFSKILARVALLFDCYRFCLFLGS